MTRAFKQIAICAGILLMICILCRLIFVRGYTAVVPARQNADNTFSIDSDSPEIARLGPVVVHPDHLHVPVHPVKQGHLNIEVRDENGELITSHYLKIGPFRTVYDMQTGGFTGDTVMMISVAVFWALVTAIMVWHYRQSKGPDFYGYATIYYAGFSLFSAVTAVLMTIVAYNHLTNPLRYTMMDVYSAIRNASWQFMCVTTSLVLVFACMMAVSNIELLRHEKPRVQNVLGIAVSVLLVAGEALGWYLFTRDFSGSEWEGRVDSTLKGVYATAFVYFECMLAGSIICGTRAARYVPAYDKDYIIVLGCWFRKDGSLPPLLRGRVDRALSFWKKQNKLTGKEAVFIPSGGQGKNESMPEADAMRRYLLEKGIRDELIIPERQAKNTYENMAFSKEIIQGINPDGKTIFATTNYHVFRSGVWANNAGLKAEGIGGKTKWWFWPNAFMRECAGLLQRRWKQEIVMLVLVIAFFALMSMVVG